MSLVFLVVSRLSRRLSSFSSSLVFLVVSRLSRRLFVAVLVENKKAGGKGGDKKIRI